METSVGDIGEFFVPDDDFSVGSFSNPTSEFSGNQKMQTPKRLPNGRFMSKSQVEAYERGVPIEEIVRQAIAEESEKKKAIANGEVKATAKKKSTKKKPPQTSVPKATAEKRAASEVGGFDGNVSTCPATAENPVASTIVGGSNVNGCLQMVNGQPVIQARLERMRTVDGNIVTVAVLPADINGILRSSGLMLPQAMNLQRASTSVSPNVAYRVASPSVDQRLPRIQPKTVLQSNDSPLVSHDSQIRQPVILPPQFPVEPFTFRLSSDDERIVGELGNRIRQYQSMRSRTAIDEAALAKLEEARTSILHRAATSQFQFLSTSQNQPSGQLRKSNASSVLPQIIQVNGAPYLTVQSTPASVQRKVAPVFPTACKQNTTNVCNAEIFGSQCSTVPSCRGNDQTQSTIVTAEILMEQRCQRLKERLGVDQRLASQPDCSTPFCGRKDALKRLLPFHLYDEPNIKEKSLSAVDADFQRYVANCKMKMKGLYERFYKTMDSMAPISTKVDSLVIGDLMLKDERLLFDEERQLAACSPDRYLETLRVPTLEQESVGNDDSLHLGDVGQLDGVSVQKESTIERCKLIDSIDGLEESTIELAVASTSLISSEQQNAASGTMESSQLFVPDPPLSPPVATKFNSNVAIDETVASDPSTAKECHPPAPTEVCREDQIEAHISVKVIIKKRRFIESDDTKASTSTRDHFMDDQSSVVGDGQKFVASVHAECGEEDTLRVPPLKIRLRCKNDKNWTPEFARAKRQAGLHNLGLDSSDTDDDSTSARKAGHPSIGNPPEVRQMVDLPDKDEDQNSATTTSPGDSGMDDDSDIGANASHDRNAVQNNDGRVDVDANSIPRLKLFRSSNRYVNANDDNLSSYFSSTRWSATNGSMAKIWPAQELDSGSNEASDEDDND